MASTTAGNSHTISNWTFGADAAGVDLKVFGDTTEYYFMWDASANKVISYGTLDLEGATTDAILIAGANTDALHISGSNTANAIHISGDQAVGILYDVDANATDGLKFDVDSSKTLTRGIYLTGSGTVTTGISIATSGTTGISLGGTFTTGITIAKTVGRAFQVGALSSDSQLGMTFVASTGYEAVSVYTDDGNAALTGGDPFVGIHSRSMFFKDQAGSTTALGIFGQQKYASGVDIGPARTAAVEGYNEFMTTNQIKDDGLVGTLSSQTEISAGVLTIASGGILAGVHVRLTGAGQATQSSGGILAGVLVDETVTTGTWGYGIYMPGSFVTNAVYIRNTQATTALPTIDSQSTFSATSGYHVGAQFYGTKSGVGTGTVYALRGHAANTATQTTQSAAEYIIGVHGRVINSGTCYSSGAIMAGVLGQVLDGGTYTAVSMLNAIWADWQNTATVTAGTKNMVYITNNANQVVDNAFYIKAGIGSGTISNLFSLNTLEVNDGMVRYQNVYTTHGGTYRNIRILINDTVYWMIVSDTPTS